MQRIRKNAVSAVAVIMVLTIALIGCTSRPSETDTASSVLRIATTYGESENNWLRQQFAEIFEFMHPNVTIEFIPVTIDGDQGQSPIEQLRTTLREPNKADLVMVDYQSLWGLIDDNLLTNLDSLIKEDQIDTGQFAAPVNNAMTLIGNGSTYALSPTFSTTALFYNKTIFDEKGVPFPRDGMTWEDMIQLAGRLQPGEGKLSYGFTFNSFSSDAFYDMLSYASPLQTMIFNEKERKMTVDTDSWERVWTSFINLARNTKLPLPDAENNNNAEASSGAMNPYSNDYFLSGQTAMTIASYNYVNQLIDANRNAPRIQGMKQIEWDVVTLPVHADQPGIGGNITINNAVGIAANAQNKKEAWEFIKFLNSKEWATTKSRSNSNELFTYVKSNKPQNNLNYNLDAFFKLEPAPYQIKLGRLFDEKPDLYQVLEIGRNKLNEVLTGDKEVRQALREWQSEGNVKLQQILS
ncbi:ABC transporter substrate-binding protein [Paenibacillus aurantiacus]|uniref:ABC transporter substrate-binding protein n=1 Tax=Paenibacillus aurantiacus TaxID=1936118 RepID=A0ABV5L0Y7_9BACL